MVTLPPAFFILASSTSSSGLWSYDMSTALPPSDTTHRESPALATISCLPRISATTAVVPLSDPGCKRQMIMLRLHSLAPYRVSKGTSTSHHKPSSVPNPEVLCLTPSSHKHPQNNGEKPEESVKHSRSVFIERQGQAIPHKASVVQDSPVFNTSCYTLSSNVLIPAPAQLKQKPHCKPGHLSKESLAP